jgi:hypothetical protein
MSATQTLKQKKFGAYEVFDEPMVTPASLVDGMF